MPKLSHSKNYKHSGEVLAYPRMPERFDLRRKLTDEQRILIRKMKGDGCTYKYLASVFSVCIESIRNVVNENRRLWRNAKKSQWNKEKMNDDPEYRKRHSESLKKQRKRVNKIKGDEWRAYKAAVANRNYHIRKGHGEIVFKSSDNKK